ncbi:hypothetical protein H4R18_003700 [Coemansia javaensis]|uniref:GH18 domain-containing protein n=1 Tax=Coemansia javaensis TaxID=2761396 RepID=A0A9W8LGW4_9FUNG|nr:hypothetical protein H4R18_003700 [Coemansia javaensis]
MHLWSAAVAAAAGLLVLGAAAQTARPHIVVGYYDMDGPDVSGNISLAKYTHVNIAFAMPDLDGSLKMTNAGFDISQLASKAHAGGAKALLSVGGHAGSMWFSRIVRDKGRSAALVSSIVSAVRAHSLDGVDIVWTDPGRSALPCYSSDKANDTPNFLGFLKGLRAGLGSEFGARSKLITLGVPTEPFSVDGAPSADVSAFSDVADYAHIMAFGINGPRQDTTGPDAPLQYEAGKGEQRSLAGAISAWTRAGWPAGKLTAGIIFGGHSSIPAADMSLDPNNQYQKQSHVVPQGDVDDRPFLDPCSFAPSYAGLWQYRNLRGSGLLPAANETAQGLHARRDAATETPWIYSPAAGRFYSYEDATSVGAKARYAASRGLAGAMAWMIHMDHNNELVGAIHTP